MYDVLVFDHRLAEYRPLDSKAELARLLFGYTTGNGQRFPAQPALVRFVVRPGRDSDDQTDMTGTEAIARAENGEGGIELPQVKKLQLDESVSPTAGRRFTRA